MIIAFFPCIRFEDQVKLWFRGDSYGDDRLSITDLLARDLRLMDELHELYDLVTMLVLVCVNKGLRLIIENPYTPAHFLKTHWALKPALIDMDRSRHGDYFKKPTQYFFVNCNPTHNLRPFIEYPTTSFIVEKANKAFNGIPLKTARSMISPTYASFFIENYLYDILKEKEEIC